MSILSRAWARVREPKSVTVQITIVYLIVGTAGLLAIANPPNSVDASLGNAYTSIWAWAMTIGGYGSAIFTPSGAWIWERPFLILVIGSGCLYLWSALIQAFGSPSGNRWVQVAWVLAAIIQLGVRLQRIFREPYEPGR